jgi:hypothetical protein
MRSKDEYDFAVLAVDGARRKRMLLRLPDWDPRARLQLQAALDAAAERSQKAAQAKAKTASGRGNWSGGCVNAADNAGPSKMVSPPADVTWWRHLGGLFEDGLEQLVKLVIPGAAYRPAAERLLIEWLLLQSAEIDVRRALRAAQSGGGFASHIRCRWIRRLASSERCRILCVVSPPFLSQVLRR